MIECRSESAVGLVEMSSDLQRVKLCLSLVCGALRRTALAVDVADKLGKYLNQIDTQTHHINGDFLNTLSSRIDAMEALFDGGALEEFAVESRQCVEHEEMQKVKLSLGLICGTLRRLASAQGVLGKVEKYIAQIDKHTSSIHGDVLTVLHHRVLAQEGRIIHKLKKDQGEVVTESGLTSSRRDDLEDLQKAKLCLGLVCATLRRVASSSEVLPKVEKFIKEIDSQTSGINGDYLNTLWARLDRIDEHIQVMDAPERERSRQAVLKARKAPIPKTGGSADDLQKVKLCLGLLCAVNRKTSLAAGIGENLKKHLIQIDQQTSGINGDVLNALLGRIQALEHRMDVRDEELGTRDESGSASPEHDVISRMEQIEDAVAGLENRLNAIGSSMRGFHRKWSSAQLGGQGPEELVDQKTLQRRLIIVEAKLEGVESDRARVDDIQARMLQLETKNDELTRLVESMNTRGGKKPSSNRERNDELLANIINDVRLAPSVRTTLGNMGVSDFSQ